MKKARSETTEYVMRLEATMTVVALIRPFLTGHWRPKKGRMFLSNINHFALRPFSLSELLLLLLHIIAIECSRIECEM